MQTFWWIIALATVALLASTVTLLLVRATSRSSKQAPLPTAWALLPRPVFNMDERRVYRLLREALPHHVLLSKLALVRFCQPAEPAEARRWYELLGAIHVTFAVCSANGRVLAAIDLDTDRGNSRRAIQIKQSVLSACRIRYLRCPVDKLPSLAELQLLVPQSGLASRGPMQPPAHPLSQARDTLQSTVASRRAERSALWHDSGLFQDSFFVPDGRVDSLGNSQFASLMQARRGYNGSAESGRSAGQRLADTGGVVVDEDVAQGGSVRH